MAKKKAAKVKIEDQEVKRRALTDQALKILTGPDIFGEQIDELERRGLTGEHRNATVLMIAGISRLLERPISVLIKGQSSSGKNHLAQKVLDLFPPDAVREITSSSEKAWNYADDDFKHRIVYLQERNESAGPVHQARLLISEGRLIRTVTVSEGGTKIAKRFVTEGPIAAISTTTKDRLEIDDETRHISLWMDESPEQTRRILQKQSAGGK